MIENKGIYDACIDDMKTWDDEHKNNIYVIVQNDQEGELVNFNGEVAYYSLVDAQADIVNDGDVVMTVAEYLKTL